MYFALDRASYYEAPCRMLDRASLRACPASAQWWNDGVPLPHPVEEPLRLSLRPLDTRSGEQSEALPVCFLASIPLLRRDLATALQDAGARLDSYAVKLRDPDDGRELDDYVAVNVLGIVARHRLGAFLGALSDEGDGLEVGYGSAEDLPEPLDGLLLAWIEDTYTLVVHQRLRDALQANGGFDELVFRPLDQHAL